ncbi:hypothetical protein EIP91_004321 [Steccherinum ochraceum]|uniref:Uncharacterized protein n=1 Tax=Steccherinum ochraceum TaxID=92696 RepID=A0A4R0R9Y8_9APHY|nr:hypothetical protein EIP91_004321 [Steccherinum ochraceum]
MQNEIFLPGELLDAIMDCLEDDKKALSTCTLLSWHWCASAKPALFRRLSIFFYDRDTTHDFDAFCKFLDEESSAFVKTVVKELTLSCDLGQQGESIGDLGLIRAYQVDELLIRLPAVQKFTLTQAAVVHSDIIPRSLPRDLEELHLHVVCYDTIRPYGDGTGCDLVHLINLFASVHTLRLSTVLHAKHLYMYGKYEAEETPETGYISEGRHISESLKIRNLISRSRGWDSDVPSHKYRGRRYNIHRPVLRLLANSRALDGLHRVSLDEDFSSTALALQMLGGRLQELRVVASLSYPRPPTMEQDPFNLSYLTVLERLHLTIHIPAIDHRDYLGWRYVGVALRDLAENIPVRVIQHLRVVFASQATMSLNKTHLAQELIDCIMSHLEAEKPSLASCTLVSRRWYTSAVPRLFRKITVNAYGNVRSLSSFQAFLDDTSSYAPLHIKFVVLSCSCYLNPNTAAPGTPEMRIIRRPHHGAIDAQTIADLLPKLPSLRAFRLSMAQLSLCDHAVQSSRIWDLDELHLEDIRYQADSRTDQENCSLVQLFNLFGSVAKLRLHSVTLEGNSYGDDAAYARAEKEAGERISKSFKVSELMCTTERPWNMFSGEGRHQSRPVLSILSHSGAAKDLRSLSLNDSFSPSSCAIEKFGSSVEHLNLAVNYFPIHALSEWTTDDSVPQDPFKISTLAALKTMNLTMRIDRRGLAYEAEANILRITEQTVKHVPPTVTRLYIGLHCAKSILELLKWDVLDAALSALPPSMTLSFGLKICGGVEEDEVVYREKVDLLVRQLPRLMSKRRSSIQWC